MKKKLEVLQALKTVYKNNRSLCSRETGIARPVICNWIKESEKFSLISESRHQSVKRVRHSHDQESKTKRAKFPGMESQLREWIKTQRQQCLAVDTTLVIEQGKLIFEKMKEEDPAYADQQFLGTKSGKRQRASYEKVCQWV